MKIESVLESATVALRNAGIPEPFREARSLLADAIRRDAAFIFAHPEFELSDVESEMFDSHISRRTEREPFQYIVGKQEFYGLDFLVDRNVLIPRPETEAIVERSIAFLQCREAPTMCEIGVGSGCISVSTLFHCGRARGVGVDISAAALAVAAKNADKQGVAERLQLIVSDIFANVPAERPFDLVVSNPPYVSLAEFSGLQPEVRDHEPALALTDHGSGLTVIEHIVREAPRFLSSGGLLLVEIGFSQADAVLEFVGSGPWIHAEIIADLQGIPRTLSAVRK
jgi:release factor glutamine methyltransferase